MKRIRKIETSVGLTGNVVNNKSTSTANAYSCDYINELKIAILDSAFPVGKVEVFFDNEDHSNYLGFKWERTLQGLTPVGIQSTDTDFATVGKTGGAKTVNLQHTHSYEHTHGVPGVAHTHTSAAHTHTTGNHTLTTNEMPSHSHSLNKNVPYGIPYNDTSGTACGAGGGVYYHESYSPFSIANSGGGGAHNHGNTGSTTPGATGSTTPSATTTNSQSTSTSGNGGSTTQSIMQPYGVVAYWKRTA